MGRERAGPDDDHVVDQLHLRQLEQPDSWLDGDEVEGRQKVEAPDQEPPRAECDRERVGEGVTGSRA